MRGLGLELQVPSILQKLQILKNGPLIFTISSSTPTIYPSSLLIRHILNPRSRSPGIRSFSTSIISQGVVRIPIRLKRKLSKNKSKSLEPAQSSMESPPAKQSITSTAFLLIHKQLYQDIVPFLVKHKTELTVEQLGMIMAELEIRSKHPIILELYNHFPGKSFEKGRIIKILMRVFSQLEEYSLVEIVFSRYLELPELKVRYCNMGLKAVIFNGNQELAKQLLYQMVYSHLPMNDSTLKSFLSAVQKSGTFQSVRFAVDLLEKNPNVPVDNQSYSTIMKCYAKNATESEFKSLANVLEKRGCDLYELELHKFYHDLIQQVKIDDEKLWSKILEIRSNLSKKPYLLNSFYLEMMSIFSYKLKRNDMFKLVELLSEDSIEFSDELNNILFSFFAKVGDVDGLLVYFASFKDKKIHIQPQFIYSLWRTLITKEPELAKIVTDTIQEFMHKHYLTAQLENKFLKAISLRNKMRNSLPDYVPAVSDKRLARSLEVLNDLLHQKKDAEIIVLINDRLRQGLRPEFPLLMSAMVGLIKIKSPEILILYKLGCQLYTDMIVDFDLVWLKKTIYDLRAENNNGLKLFDTGSALIGDFKLKHGDKMTHSHFNDLANICIDIFNYDLAIELLQESRASSAEVEKRNNLNIYITLLKALARKKDLPNYLHVMKLFYTDDDVKLSTFGIKRLKTGRQYFIKKNAEEPFENFEEFLNQFDIHHEKIKEKYTTQREEAQESCRNAIEFFEEWNKET